ncbi:NAD+ synthase [Sulfuriflexus sp.]|uniref:NAD+ synthase n=1 Tax=Sulfuriflexus sp. TaxID=2015443 RepID=UPI0028CC6799|nr:NAD+ synthase [Sulfuriflexus sp.]MDT8404585.1 NAD+ synthase [Sulfuriflexus sp.]
MPQSLRIVMAQINTLVGDIECNTNQVIASALRARDEMQADAIVFPELTLSGYPPEDLLLRPGLSMATVHGLERVKKAVRGIDVILGYPQKERGGLYNVASLLRDGQLLATCHKQHLPNYSVFDEMRYFVPGAAEPCVVEIKGVPVGLTVCEDLWMPDPVRQAAGAGARLILNLNASPYHLNKHEEREAVLYERATESGLPIVYVNLVGGQDELVFDGSSTVVNAQGEITQRAPAYESGLYPVDFNIDEQGRVTPLEAEIVPVQGAEASVYGALVLGVHDYIEKNGFRGVVIGLSGGIDSALTLAVAVDALGADRVEAVSMPSRYTAGMSIDDARAEAELLGVDFKVLPIEKPFSAFLECLADEFAGLPVDTTEENIQARCRGVMLMAIANKKRRIVLTTGNKSEMAVGYATLYGDMAGGFDVLKDVPKLMVYRLSEYRNTLSAVIPARVITRPPSAELAPDQKDQDSLPPYEELDPILSMYVEQDMTLEEIVARGYASETVERVIGMVDRNEYKRRQAAPGVRVTQRAFGRDRRYPITSGYRSGKCGWQV